MASVICKKVNSTHVVLSLKMDFNEAKMLKGCIDNIHLIPEENSNVRSTVYERGKNGHTKYFLIPKQLRENIQLKKEVSCMRIDCKEKIVWAYIMDKL